MTCKRHWYTVKTKEGQILLSSCNKCNEPKPPKKVRKKAVKRNRFITLRYGITLEEYDALLIHQKYVCAICKEKCSTKQALCVDHDHITGKVRGLLCRKCNSLIGKGNDNLVILKSAIKYLQKYDVKK